MKTYIVKSGNGYICDIPSQDELPLMSSDRRIACGFTLAEAAIWMQKLEDFGLRANIEFGD